MPERIQLRRTKGWRKPEEAIVVARPSKWGNPYRVGEPHYLAWDTLQVFTAASAVRAFREMLTNSPDFIAEIRAELSGHDLACWCPLGQPCHADVLLELANAGPERTSREDEANEPAPNDQRRAR